MTRILLIPAGRTFWTEQGRLAGSADMPLSKEGYGDAQAVARMVAEGQRPQIIYTGTNQASRETLAVIAQGGAIKTKVLEGLEEPDMGLWEGLTPQDLQHRSPKAYRQFLEEPAKVNPPSGEPLGEALTRLVERIDRVAVKHKSQAVGLMIGPLAEFLLQSWRRSPSFEEHWSGREAPQITLLAPGVQIFPDADKNPG